jgi:hypothetical protein
MYSSRVQQPWCMQGDGGGRMGTSDLLKQLVRVCLPRTTDQKVGGSSPSERASERATVLPATRPGHDSSGPSFSSAGHVLAIPVEAAASSRCARGRRPYGRSQLATARRHIGGRSPCYAAAARSLTLPGVGSASRRIRRAAACAAGVRRPPARFAGPLRPRRRGGRRCRIRRSTRRRTPRSSPCCPPT